MKKINKIIPAMGLGLCLLTPTTQAANWLFLQGAEKPGQAPRAKVWGFIQAEYQKTDDTKLKGASHKGQSAAFNQIRPQLSSADTFSIKRARIGVRGTGFPLDPKVNYFFLAEFGNNGLTTGKGASVGQLSDASITLNHIPGARIRVGQFKTPLSEEGYQGIATFNYINFSSGADRLLLERYFDYASSSTGNSGSSTTTTNVKGGTGRLGAVGAFRDTGIQVFDKFNIGGLEHSYSIMIGNGNGVGRVDVDNNKDTYLYYSVEKLLGGGRGPWIHSMKFYAWRQSGKRAVNIGGTVQDKERTRQGIGMTYFDGKYRAAAEYYTAKGMIFAGTDGGAVPGATSNNGSSQANFNIQTDQEAYAYYIDLGYKILPKLELDYRYDVLDSGTSTTGGSNAASDERVFKNHTIGFQYSFNKKSIMRVYYEKRSIEAPDLSALPSNKQSAINAVLDSIDSRIGLQVTTIF